MVQESLATVNFEENTIDNLLKKIISLMKDESDRVSVPFISPYISRFTVPTWK